MKTLLILAALATLTACGGGGGNAIEPANTAPQAQQPAIAAERTLRKDPIPATPQPANPNCVLGVDNVTRCDLMPGVNGVGVPAASFVIFTNRTGQMLQLDQVEAYTGERVYWSEFCAYKGTRPEDFITGQVMPGTGEVGCVVKNVGDDYAPLHWGTTTGLSVAPGEQVVLNSHTEPALVSHLYTLTISYQTTGVHVWRQPQMDKVFICDGAQQSTEWSPWRNDTGRNLHITGAGVYSVTGGENRVDAACLYVFAPDGQTIKYGRCDLAEAGDKDLGDVIVEPGDYIVGHATNQCPAGSAAWDWAAFLRVW
jgi:predicted small lipoprotein YifL